MFKTHQAIDNCSIVTPGTIVTPGERYTRRGIPRIEVTIVEENRTIVLEQEEFSQNFIAVPGTPAAQ